MGLASSTVSEQIKKLELHYEVQLFERKVREIVLTKKGEEVYTHAKKVFSSGMRLIDNLTFQDDGGYDVTFSIESHLESPKIASVLADYFCAYRDFGHTKTKRAKNFSQSMYFLENETVDIAISDNKLTNDMFNHYLVAQNQLKIYVSKELAKKYKDLPLEQIVKKLPVGFLCSDEKLIVNAKQIFKEHKVYLKDTFFSEHLDYLANLCLRGEIALAAIGDEQVFHDFVCISPEFEIHVPTYAIFKKQDENLLFARKLKEVLDIDSDAPLQNLH